MYADTLSTVKPFNTFRVEDDPDITRGDWSDLPNDYQRPANWFLQFSPRHYIEDDPNVTRGSLPDLPNDYPGTVNWPLQPSTQKIALISSSRASRRSIMAPVRYSHVELDDYIEATGTSISYDFLIHRVTTDDFIEIDQEMIQLEIAANAGDERAFLAVHEAMNWSGRPPEDFIYVIQLALSVGAYQVARHLSTQGAEYYSQHSKLQKYARILSPPKVIRNDLPPDPTLKTNRDWLKTHSESYRGQWVALRDGQLIGSADSLKSLVDQIGNTEDILLTKVF